MRVHPKKVESVEYHIPPLHGRSAESPMRLVCLQRAPCERRTLSILSFRRLSLAMKCVSMDVMTLRPIDIHALRIPRESGLSLCLYITIAAKDVQAIETFVGKIVEDLGGPRSPGKAFLVEMYEPDEPDRRLAIWDLAEAQTLHYPRQVWVHVDYRSYRRAYCRAFPDEDVSKMVLDHVMNRRVARLNGFQFLRIVPISRGANSSHGSLSEGWGVDYHSSPEMVKKNATSMAVVQYADICDIVKMMDMKGGGSFMENVNDAQKLVDLPPDGEI